MSRLTLDQPPHFQQHYPPLNFQQPPIGSAPVGPIGSPINGEALSLLQIPALGSGMTQPVPTSPTGPPPPFPPPVSTSITPTATPIPIRPSPHSDLTEDISDILRSSFSNGSCGASTINHNNNQSSDKRLFTKDDSPPNHKEEVSDEKPNHRGKRKAKVTSSTAKQNQHKHTNGLSTEKVLSNCLNILNGDENLEEEEMEKWRTENNETRSQAFKEIRKFGRDYSGLYEQLEKIKGTYDMRFDFVQMCIVEANRFRRKQMVNCIQEWWETQTEGKNGDTKTKMKS